MNGRRKLSGSRRLLAGRLCRTGVPFPPRRGLAPLSLFSDINETRPEADSFADSSVDRIWAHDWLLVLFLQTVRFGLINAGCALTPQLRVPIPSLAKHDLSTHSVPDGTCTLPCAPQGLGGLRRPAVPCHSDFPKGPTSPRCSPGPSPSWPCLCPHQALPVS